MKRILLLFLMFLICLQNIPLLGEAENSPSESEKRLERLAEEENRRKEEVRRNPGRPHSDEYTGQKFKAAGKEWLVGKYNICWKETQEWIKGLKEGWRTPNRDDLRSLHNSVGKTSVIDAIHWTWVWAEKKDSSLAWQFDFGDGFELPFPLDYRHFFIRAVAVR